MNYAVKILNKHCDKIMIPTTLSCQRVFRMLKYIGKGNGDNHVQGSAGDGNAGISLAVFYGNLYAWMKRRQLFHNN